MYLAWVSRKSWKRHLVQTFGVIGHKELEETFGTKFWSNWSQRAQVNSYSALFVNNSLSARQMLTTVYAIKNHWIYLSLPKCRKFLRKKILNVLRCFSVSAKTSTRKYMLNQQSATVFLRIFEELSSHKSFLPKNFLLLLLQISFLFFQFSIS